MTKCLPKCHAADANTNHTCRSGLRSSFVASVGGLSTGSTGPHCFWGRELPKPPDLRDRESGRVFKMLCPLCARGGQVSCTSFCAPCSAGAGVVGAGQGTGVGRAVRSQAGVSPGAFASAAGSPTAPLHPCSRRRLPIFTSIAPGKPPCSQTGRSCGRCARPSASPAHPHLAHPHLGTFAFALPPSCSRPCEPPPELALLGFQVSLETTLFKEAGLSALSNSGPPAPRPRLTAL